MTTEKATLLMNMYFANDATDDELKELFVHLSESPKSRLIFTEMKNINDSLIRKIDLEYPQAIDTRLSSLLITEKKDSFLHRKYALSFTSALLSTFLIGMLSVIVFSLFSRTLSTQEMVERQQTLKMLSAAGEQIDQRSHH